MVGYGFLNAAGCHHRFQLLAHRPVVHFAEYQFVFLQVFVAVDNLQGDVHQLHLEGDIRLVSLTDNPLVTVDVHDVVRGQVLHVYEREGGEAHEYKNVTHKGKIVVLEFMGYDGFQFFLCQELPFLAIGTDVELGKRVTGNLTVVVCVDSLNLPELINTFPLMQLSSLRCQLSPFNAFSAERFVSTSTPNVSANF